MARWPAPLTVWVWHAVQIRLSTQWPVWSHCHRGTTSSDDETGRSHWVPAAAGLVSRVDVTAIPIKCPLLQPAQQVQRWWRDQAGLWVIPGEHATRILFDWRQRVFLKEVTYALLLRMFPLNLTIHSKLPQKILRLKRIHNYSLQLYIPIRYPYLWETPRESPYPRQAVAAVLVNNGINGQLPLYLSLQRRLRLAGVTKYATKHKRFRLDNKLFLPILRLTVIKKVWRLNWVTLPRHSWRSRRAEVTT